jgi:hypothetical protein
LRPPASRFCGKDTIITAVIGIAGTTVTAAGTIEQLINLCLQKANWKLTFEEIVAQLATDEFRQIYIHLDPKVQGQIEILISPPSLLHTPVRKQRTESEIWQARHLIHKLKTEVMPLGKTRTRRTWKEVTKALHEQNVLTEKTQEQIYWSLKDKRETPHLAEEDKVLLDQIFARNERGKIKEQIEQMAEAIELARVRLSWEETHTTLQDFFGWSGTLKQLMGAYARIRVERSKNKPADQQNNETPKPQTAAPELKPSPAPAPASATAVPSPQKRPKRDRKKVTA